MGGQVVSRILGYVKKYKGLLAVSLVCALLSVTLGLLGPVLIGRAIDGIIGVGNVDFNLVLQTLVWLAVTVVAAAVLQWLMLVCTRKISARAAQDMRQQAFNRVNEVPLKMIDTHSHGDMVSRMVNDVDAVAEGLLQGMTQLFPGVVTILATVVVMLVLNWPIALVVILVTPLSILFSRFVARRTSRMFRAQNAAQGQISGFVGEMVRGQALLRAFGGEQASEEEFMGLNDQYFDANLKATFYSSVSNPGTRFVNSVVYAAVGVFGAILAINGGITVGGLSAFLSYANQYTKPFNEVSAVLTQLQNAVSAAERLFEVIDWQPEPPDTENAVTLAHSDGAVRAEHVYFSYRKDTKLIQDFSMDTKPGQRVALVGTTGCGKTTIINLLMRFYELDEGSIYVDDTRSTVIKRDSLRSLYGMVLQETWLKEATVRENIAYGKPGASDEEVIEAAKAAYAHRFIKRLPQGYDTVLEPGGSNLSAGQRQLLCIARVMLEKPDMLILDEATSSIDTRTEMLIQKALDKLMTGHTSFVVAHRLSTIQNADVILVMEAGRVVERGRHEELLEKNGYYAKLYNSQFAYEETR